jgi:hypothetical protein
VGAIGPDHEVKVDFNFPGAPIGRVLLIADFKPSFPVAEISTSQFVVEE